MKTLIISSVIALMVTAGVPALHAQPHEFERSPNFQKLDGRARTAWTDAMRTGNKKRELDVLVKVAERLDQKDKQRLAGTGFKPGAIIQTIVTGRIEADKVPALASLDFVRIIELAVPLDIKKDPGYQKYGAPPARRPATELPAATPAPATLPAAPVTTAQPAAAPVPPIQQGEVSVEVPIYESARPDVTYPNRPPTSDEFVDQAPAISPVDQAAVPIGTRPTVTQPIVGTTPHQNVQVQVETEIPTPAQPAPQPAQESPVYAPPPSAQ